MACEICTVLLGGDERRTSWTIAALEALDLSLPGTYHGRAFRLGSEWFDANEVIVHRIRHEEELGLRTWRSKLEGHPALTKAA
ncbi:MAG: hypothetical protein AB1627_02510 [Chloroflexota bacterium]